MTGPVSLTWPLVAAGVVVGFWALLALFTAVNLMVFRRPPVRSAAEVGPAGREPLPVGGGPRAARVSIVIPARDEERALAATLEAALAQDWPELEVVVVDDRSRDATGEIATRFAAADRRVTVVDGAEPPPGWLGKPHALAQGTAVARGDWLLFLDADVRLHPRAVSSALARARRRGLDHLALFPHFRRRGLWEQVLMPSLALTLLVYFPSFLSRWRRLRRLAFGSGSFNLVRAIPYRRLGGHARLRDSVIDDLRLAVELKSAGYHSALALGDHLASIRMYHGRREIFAGFEKNLHALLARHPLFSLFNLTAGTALNLAPFAWPLLAVAAPAAAFAPAGRLLALALAVALACRTTVHLRLGYPLWPVLLHPLTTLAGSWIAARSLAAAYGEGVVRWRGRTYRRRDTGF